MIRVTFVILACSGLIGCSAMSDTRCSVTAIVTPANATADHALAAPGNQVKFTTSFTTSGNCALPQNVALGTWSTSDPTDISITTVSGAAAAVATCLNATSTPATISYSGIEYGAKFTSATLTCK